jgi:hypothetical protein
VEGEHVERDELRGLRQQRASDTGESRPDDVGRDEPGVHPDADGGGAQRVALHRAQRPAEGRMDQPARHEKGQEEDNEAVGGGHLARQVELEQAEDRPDLHALQAVRPAGQPR